ncbi:MAG: cytochrome P450 [Vicinamibacterales bacterium]
MSTPIDRASDPFDPRSRAFRVDPYPAYDFLRRHSPVHQRPEKNDWLVSRYSDVVALLKDPRLGYARPPGQETLSNAGAGPYKALLERTLRAQHLWLNFQEPPDHTRIGMLLQGTFHPDNRSSLRARLQLLADRHLDRALDRGRMDVVNDLAGPVTSTIICDIVGVPEGARRKLEHLTREIHYLLDVDQTQIGRDRGMLAMMALTELVHQLISGRRRQGKVDDDLISVLLRAESEGQISEVEVLAQCSMVLVVGQINSKLLISNGAFTLLKNQDKLRALRARPDLLDSAINELLRFETPTQVVSRHALEDVQVNGTLIRKGENVRLLIGSANRDPEAFVDPDVLDITRAPNLHVSFGHGVHYCLGAMLARLEAHVTIGTLLRRLPSIRFAEAEAEWEDMFVMRGLRSLPVVFG